MPLLPTSFLPFWIRGEEPGDARVRRQGLILAIFVGICLIAALYASLYAPSGEGEWGWYPRLAKPSWAIPPVAASRISSVFYLILAVAMWRIWRTGAFRTVPFTLAGFACLFLLQTLWSTFFYGMQSPLLGLADLTAIALLAWILWLTYKPIDRWAARLWLGYLVWTLLLLAVNFAIWWMNG